MVYVYYLCGKLVTLLCYNVTEVINMLAIQAPPVPLREEPEGTFRVGSSRVLLDVIVATFNQGYTPQQIVESFDTLKLEDVYGVITYYLNNREMVDTYIAERQAVGEELYEKFQSLPTSKSSLSRETLLARRQANSD